MYGPSKALFVAAVVLQASANPVFKRQITSSAVTLTQTPGNFSSSLPSITSSAPLPLPTPPGFPFPGGNSTNGTYYICSFPSSDDATTSTLPLSTDTLEPTASVSATDVLSTTSASLTDDVLAAAATTSGSAVPTTTLASVTVTDPPVSLRTASATTFTVVGPSTTAVIECIEVPVGGHHHHGTATSWTFTPTATATATTPDGTATSTATF
ncbi:hypothetical protein BDV93DRAFT_521612 [Ceratobasidium sp. AG-I]|nr:hypothetical protein BDV93DRAFT_521612 [Ceratobasidium sp. AG-I]